MATSPWYREGTAKFTQGSTTVTGTGTRWVDFVRAGDGIQGPDGKLYQVTNVASNTSMSITPAYGSETTYWTIPIQGYVKRLADAASQLVRDFEGGADEALDAADRAKQSAIEAKASETASAISESKAKVSETAAKSSETKAKTSETNSKASETAAKSSQTAAKNSETNAGVSAVNASASETKAKASETAAKNSEESAEGFKNNASASATAAKASENKSLTQANKAETEADRAKTEADRSRQAADDAVSVVTDGGGSIDPEAGKWPVAGAEGTIKQAWVHELEFALDKLRVATNKALYGDGPYPVLDFQFAGAKMLDPRIEFTRASVDWDSQGREYGIDEPVLTDEGLSVWGKRANLTLSNEEFSLTHWGFFGVEGVKTGQPGPYGKGEAYEIRETHREDGAHYLMNRSITYVSGNTYTLSVYAKRKEGSPERFLRFYIQPTVAGQGGHVCVFDLEQGEVMGDGGKITYSGDGWWRCEKTFVSESDTTTTYHIRLSEVFSLGINPYQNVDDAGMLIWRPQMEVSREATPAIPTGDSIVEVAQTVPVTSLTGNLTSGSFLIHALFKDWDQSRPMLDVYSQTNEHRIRIGVNRSGVFHGTVSRGGSSTNYPTLPKPTDLTAGVRVVVTFDEYGTVRFSVNGMDVVTDTSPGLLFINPSIFMGTALTKNSHLDGSIVSFSYFDRALTIPEMMKLSNL